MTAGFDGKLSTDSFNTSFTDIFLRGGLLPPIAIESALVGIIKHEVDVKHGI
jgi:hypothetical protein